MLTFQICLGSVYNGFSAIESREVSLNGNVYDFSVDYNFVDKSEILKIHMYLMTSLLNHVGYAVTWVTRVRGCVCYVGPIITWVAWVTWVKIFFTWVNILRGS